MAGRKEEQIRLRIESIYNMAEADFGTKREWDDYLEEREDIMYKLTEGEDVAATEARVREYERGDRAGILEREAKKVEAKYLKAKPQAADAAPEALPSAEGPTYLAAAAAAVPQAPAPQPQPQPAGDPAGGPGHNFGKQLTPEEAHEVALICGWSPDFQRERLRQEAFSCLLAGCT